MNGLSISRSRATTSRSTCSQVEQRLVGQRVHPATSARRSRSHDEVGAVLLERLDRRRRARADARPQHLADARGR